MCGIEFFLSVSISVFNADVLALDIAEIVECFPEGSDVRLLRIVWFHRDQDADPRDFARRLRLGGERRGENGNTNAAKERAPVHHSIN
jgi:hypothetical protein